MEPNGCSYSARSNEKRAKKRAKHPKPDYDKTVTICKMFKKLKYPEFPVSIFTMTTLRVTVHKHDSFV